MSTAEMLDRLSAMPAEERHQTLRSLLTGLYPESGKIIDRILRRIEHPEIPEDVWQGFEEAEDGKGIEIQDAHFSQPPV
jgi:hypothetical protein